LELHVALLFYGSYLFRHALPSIGFNTLSGALLLSTSSGALLSRLTSIIISATVLAASFILPLLVNLWRNCG
jgi:hypothetical protein